MTTVAKGVKTVTTLAGETISIFDIKRAAKKHGWTIEFERYSEGRTWDYSYNIIDEKGPIRTVMKVGDMRRLEVTLDDLMARIDADHKKLIAKLSETGKGEGDEMASQKLVKVTRKKPEANEAITAQSSAEADLALE